METSFRRYGYQSIIDFFQTKLFEELQQVLQEHQIVLNSDISFISENEKETFIVWTKNMLETNTQDSTVSLCYNLTSTPAKQVTYQIIYYKSQAKLNEFINFKNFRISTEDQKHNNDLKREIAKITNTIFNFYRDFFYNYCELYLAEMPIQLTLTANNKLIVSYVPQIKFLIFYETPFTGQFLKTRNAIYNFARDIKSILYTCDNNGFNQTLKTTCN